MKIYLIKRSYFTFRGRQSYELELCGETILGRMQRNLGAEVAEGELPPGEKAVIYPVYPFLTREKFEKFLALREGSFSFEGGYVVRRGRESVLDTRVDQGLFTLMDYAAARTRAAEEASCFWAARGVLIEAGAEVSRLSELGEGAVVEKGAKLTGRCKVGRNATVGSFSELNESEVGEGSRVQRSVLDHAVVGKNCTVGPYAYLRPQSVVGDGCRVGDFVELKNARLGDGCKAAHLAYVGDAELGRRVNVGCGVVFANYNGRKKARSVVGDGCFLGSNCNLVAPVRVGDGVYLAAGTTLTQDLDGGDFCIGRCRETVKAGRAKDYLPGSESPRS